MLRQFKKNGVPCLFTIDHQLSWVSTAPGAGRESNLIRHPSYDQLEHPRIKRTRFSCFMNLSNSVLHYLAQNNALLYVHWSLQVATLIFGDAHLLFLTLGLVPIPQLIFAKPGVLPACLTAGSCPVSTRLVSNTV